ncbi:hypothetical protein COOONC_26934 [Cooperia oncophora]
MGAIESKVDVDKIHKEVSSTPVMIYTKDGCGFCTRAKTLLDEEKIESLLECNVESIIIEISNPDYEIFICGRFVGGCTDLEKLRESRKLYEAVLECTAENSQSD